MEHPDAPQPIDLPQELVGEQRCDPARDVLNISTDLERELVNEATK